VDFENSFRPTLLFLFVYEARARPDRSDVRESGMMAQTMRFDARMCLLVLDDYSSNVDYVGMGIPKLAKNLKEENSAKRTNCE
jgi:hypothetical protein